MRAREFQRRAHSTGRLAFVAALLAASSGASLEAQASEDAPTRDSERRPSELRLEVRGRPPTPQVLTVRPRAELDWTRSVLDRLARAEPTLVGAPPALHLRVVPVEAPRTPGELVPGRPPNEEGRSPREGASGTRDPPDPR